jgi:undecaprenyl-diphosphatase
MDEYAASAILGVVQGLTEFLPVSSSGHLIIASALLGLDGVRIQTFEIIIQFSSILAIIVLYRPRFQGLLFPKIAPTAGSVSKVSRFSGIRGVYLLFLTSLPAGIVGLLLHKYIKLYLFTPITVASALIVGALFILVTEHKSVSSIKKYTSVDEITPRLALKIGLFQCLSLWPGFSRSTSTIMGGLFLGTNRAVAAEYSFLAAVPIMTAATTLSLWSAADTLTQSDIPFFAVGALVSFLAAWTAVQIFIGLLSRISFKPFAWYRLAISPFILWFWS